MDPPASGAKWWEGETFNDEQRTALTAKGLTTDDPLEMLPKLLDMHLQAERRLGSSPDDLLSKPKEGQSVAEWLKDHGEAFDIPKDADGYDIKAPDDWPDGADWDEQLAGQLQTIAHEEGITKAAAQRVADLYAGQVKGLLEKAETDLKDANAAMIAELQKDFGNEAPARMARAQQAASVLAEKAGLDTAQLEGVAAALKPKVGDAGTIKLFDAIADMMGDDNLVGAGRGGTGLVTTPAEARARIAQMRAPDGDYGKAYAAGNRVEMERLQPEIDRLTKIAGS